MGLPDNYIDKPKRGPVAWASRLVGRRKSMSDAPTSRRHRSQSMGSHRREEIFWAQPTDRTARLSAALEEEDRLRKEALAAQKQEPQPRVSSAELRAQGSSADDLDPMYTRTHRRPRAVSVDALQQGVAARAAAQQRFRWDSGAPTSPDPRAPPLPA